MGAPCDPLQRAGEDPGHASSWVPETACGMEMRAGMLQLEGGQPKSRGGAESIGEQVFRLPPTPAQEAPSGPLKASMNDHSC